MKRYTRLIVTVAAALAAASAYAQENARTPGTVELTVIPGGAMLFVSGNSESRFGNYDVGGSLVYNINRYVGVEGEGNVALGINHQHLVLGATSMTEAPPNMVDMSGNVTVSAPGGMHHTTPYFAGGLGSMVLLTHTDLGISNSKAFFTGNAGGGLKWYADGRWGLRADYRLVMIRSSDSAPEFFGREGRFAHRIYAGVILNLVE